MEVLLPGIESAATHATPAATPDPLTNCPRPGMEPAPPQHPGHYSWTLNPLCRDGNSPGQSLPTSTLIQAMALNIFSVIILTLNRPLKS